MIKYSFSFNGMYYGSKSVRTRNGSKEKFYKSHNVRFDDTCGGTEECSAEEFFEVAEEHKKLFG